MWTFCLLFAAASAEEAAPDTPRATILPPLTTSDVRRVAENIDASINRPGRLAALREVSDAAASALSSPGAYAAAELKLPPRRPPFGPEFPATAGCAILLHGQVRSFLSTPVQRFWREWIASAGRAKPTVFGALDMVTYNRADKVGSSGKSSARVVDEVAIERVFETLGVPYVAAWNASMAAAARAAGAVEMAVHALMVADIQGLRDLLGDPRRPEMRETYKRYSGCYLGYSKRVIAFGALLRWERQHRQSFAHAVFVRPDLFLPDLLARHNGVGFFARLAGLEAITVLSNDIFAACPRSHAYSYSSSIALLRLRDQLDAEPAGADVDVAFLRTVAGIHGGVIQHTNMLAYDGLLFAGGGFEYDPDQRHKASLFLDDGAPLYADGAGPIVVRELDAAGRVCSEHPSGQIFMMRSWNMSVSLCPPHK